MLMKCFKYEFKKMVKFLCIFYFLSLFFSGLSRAIGMVGDSFAITFLTAFTQGAAISMMFSVLINCFMRTWAEIRTSFYSDQAYLTHSLPVEKKDHYFSKVITAVILVFVNMIVILGSLAILFLNKEVWTFLKGFLEPVAQFFDVNMYVMLGALFVIVYLELLSGMASGFFGIIMGHRHNQHKILSSIIYGFVFYLLGEVVLLITLVVAGLFDPSFMDIFTTSNLFALGSDMAVTLVIISTVVYFLFATAGFYLGYHFFKKGVNVD